MTQLDYQQIYTYTYVYSISGKRDNIHSYIASYNALLRGNSHVIKVLTTNKIIIKIKSNIIKQARVQAEQSRIF